MNKESFHYKFAISQGEKKMPQIFCLIYLIFGQSKKNWKKLYLLLKVL